MCKIRRSAPILVLFFGLMWLQAHPEGKIVAIAANGNVPTQLLDPN